MPVIKGEKYAFNLWFKEYNAKKLYSNFNSKYTLITKIAPSVSPMSRKVGWFTTTDATPPAVFLNWSCNNKVLNIYTNKCSKVFALAGEGICNNINGKYGIIYYDTKCKTEIIIDNWKSYNLQTIFIAAPRSKTICMDDKINFHKRMSESIFTPESYLKVDEIIDKNALYFVKKTGSTLGKGVNIYNYNKLQEINTTGCVIQKNITNPDLYDDKRYKIRQLVLLYNKNVYLHENSFFTSSNINYKSDGIDISDNLRNTHVISQNPDIKFELTNKLTNFELIYDNIKLAVIDFKKYYSKDINTFEANEYCVLGFDFIVDNTKNVQIIEINDRPNFTHPENVNIECDVKFFKDMMSLLLNGENNNLMLI